MVIPFFVTNGFTLFGGQNEMRPITLFDRGKRKELSVGKEKELIALDGNKPLGYRVWGKDM